MIFQSGGSIKVLPVNVASCVFSASRARKRGASTSFGLSSTARICDREFMTNSNDQTSSRGKEEVQSVIEDVASYGENINEFGFGKTR